MEDRFGSKSHRKRRFTINKLAISVHEIEANGVRRWLEMKTLSGSGQKNEKAGSRLSRLIVTRDVTLTLSNY
jgi:hypothetical protein